MNQHIENMTLTVVVEVSIMAPSRDLHIIFQTHGFTDSYCKFEGKY